MRLSQIDPGTIIERRNPRDGALTIARRTPDTPSGRPTYVPVGDTPPAGTPGYVEDRPADDWTIAGAPADGIRYATGPATWTCRVHPTDPDALADGAAACSACARILAWALDGAPADDDPADGEGDDENPGDIADGIVWTRIRRRVARAASRDGRTLTAAALDQAAADGLDRLRPMA